MFHPTSCLLHLAPILQSIPDGSLVGNGTQKHLSHQGFIEGSCSTEPLCCLEYQGVSGVPWARLIVILPLKLSHFERSHSLNWSASHFMCVARRYAHPSWSHFQLPIFIRSSYPFGWWYVALKLINYPDSVVSSFLISNPPQFKA